jgi:hypothetical protein
MIQVTKENNDQQGEQFWMYALESVMMFGKKGMSDEEDAEESVVVDGCQTTQPVRRVQILWFRHVSFRKLFQIIDETPKKEPGVFTQQGRTSVKRVRSDIVDRRDPPKGLPESVFRREYLETLLPYQRAQFDIRKKPFKISEVASD